MSSRRSIPSIAAAKGGTPLVVLTAYTAPIARLLDEQVDVLLVGDSLGMALYGHPNTLSVSLDMMIHHTRAVVAASSHAAVVVDLPFGAYQASPAQALESSVRVLAETGAQAVKLEGGRTMEETIRFLADRGIPVMGHVGLLPQHVQALGGFKQQGKSPEAAAIIEKDAKAVSAAGAFAVVLESIPAALAERITHALPIPTIGIGAGSACDGQVLVIDDVIGLTASPPPFARAYANVAEQVKAAAARFAADVRSKQFPA